MLICVHGIAEKMEYKRTKIKIKKESAFIQIYWSVDAISLYVSFA